LDRVRSIFQPPTFPGAETTRLARLLNTVLRFTVAVLSLALLSLPFVDRALASMILLVGLALPVIGCLALLHRGHVQFVARFLVLVLWAAVSALLATTGGIVNPEAAGLVVVIMAAGLLAGLRASLVFAGLSALSAVAIYVLGANGLLVNLFPISPSVALVVTGVNIVMVTGLLYLALSSLDRALGRAAAYAQELEAERAMLEERVSERTASLEAARQEAEAARREAEAAWRQAEAERESVQAINALNDVMRGEQEVDQLADSTIGYLCRHLGAQSGALFVMDLAHNRLELAGSFARAGDGALASRFEMGEGLVGQAALEKRPITLEEIPDGELTIASALGQHVPRTVLILPLVYENQVVGVIELGTLSRFSPAQLDLLHRAASTVAVAFHSAQTRKRVNELLVRTQQQAEELQAQEEELRAINEELLAQAESLSQHGPGSGTS